jgi:peptide chain release factor 3
MSHGLCPPFDLETYRDGNLTPVFFGSAINNFGVRMLLDGLAELAPSPRPQPAEPRSVEPLEESVTGFVFKIQANMDPNHRDRIAFVRLCSGNFERGMKLKHVRSGKTLTVHNPLLFLARDRELAEEAWAGDILGLPNHGNLRIGDTLTEGEDLRFTGIPSFAPEFLKRVRPIDPMRAKHLGRALQQLAEEGAAQAFRPRLGNEWIVGVAGPLQFEVLADRIRTEYDIEVRFENTNAFTARWVESDDAARLKSFADSHEGNMADDHDQEPVFLPTNQWRLDRAIEDFPDVRFLETREQIQ